MRDRTIRGDHGVDDGQRQGLEQRTRRAAQEQNRHEHDADGQRRDQGRRGDLLRAFQDGMEQGLAQPRLR